MTSQILDLSPSHLPKPQVVDLNSVVQDLNSLLRSIVGADLDLVRDLTPSLRPVRADRQHVEVVLATLVLNARESLPPGGCITIETTNMVLPKPLAHTFGTVPSGLYVRLAVRDSGAAPDLVTQASWFDRIAHPAPASPSNPGMPYVHYLIRQNGGHFAVESRAGQGSAALVYLPQAGEE